VLIAQSPTHIFAQYTLKKAQKLSNCFAKTSEQGSQNQLIFLRLTNSFVQALMITIQSALGSGTVANE
jgi:hypothetical protein